MDTNLELRAASAGNLTGESTLTDLPWILTDKVNYLHCSVPSVSSGDSLIVKAVFQDASNNTWMQTWSKSITSAGHYVIPLVCDDKNVTDLSVTLDTTANNSQAISFGAVVVWISDSRESA